MSVIQPILAAVWDGVKRLRAAVKGIYGDDSSKCDMVGGTRKSERKPPIRKPKTASAIVHVRLS
jgi:hypothetical protein